MTRIAPETRSHARKLRHNATPQEVRLWRELRDLNRRLGLNFRRQAPVGCFIADFADLGRRLIIEVDGGQHGGPRDTARDAWLGTQGFTLLRFWNSDLNGNLEGVMQTVLDAVEAAPAPHPSPTRGEGAAGHRAGCAAQGASPPPCGEGMGVGGTTPEEEANP
jgi:very-short-patch-repair endonuclease